MASAQGRITVRRRPKDGEPGKDGQDAYILDLDNEMQAVPCDASGNPTLTGILASTRATVYRGANPDTGWKFSKTDEGCLSLLAIDGTVSVRSISADTASVTVTATKDGMTRSAVMTLYKVKAGADGASAVIYSIESSASSISHSASGTMSPSAITVYKNKTTGTAKTRTSEMILKYRRAGQDRGEQLLEGEGGVIEISTSVTAVFLKLYADDGTTLLDSERIPVVKDGADGADGADGEDAVNIIVTPQTLILKPDGTRQTDIRVYVDLYKGDKRVPYADAQQGNMTCSTLTPTVGGTVVNGLRWNFGEDNTDGSPRFYYTFTYSGGTIDTIIPFSVSYNGHTYYERLFVKTVKDGSQGMQGCIYRKSEYQDGIEYHNDKDLVTDELRYIDIAGLSTDGTSLASRYKWFLCKKTHTSNADNKPELTSDGKEPWLEYWEPLSSESPIYTPLLLADDAVITFLQSNQIVVMKADGTTVNLCMGGGNYPLWIGAPHPDDASFNVDFDGRAHMTDAEVEGRIMAGNADGQRIEMQPDNKSMKIYDADGNEVSSFEGNTYTSLAKLFGSVNGNFAMSGDSKGSASVQGVSADTTAVLSKEYRASSVFHSDTPVEVLVSGHMQTGCTDPSSGDDVSTPYAGGSGGSLSVVTVGNANRCYASATLAVYVCTYADSGLTNLTGKTQVAACSGNGNRTLNNARVKTTVAGYHVITVTVTLSAKGGNQKATAAWGSAVSGKANLSASYTTDFYVSRFFANGFCLGRGSNNYIWAYNQGTKGMRLVMENGGYGIDLSGDGIKTRHHGGSWTNMQMLVFHGRAYFLNNGYTWAQGFKLSHGGSPSLSRLAEGKIKLTFPTAWISAGITPANCIINVVGYGTVQGGSSPVKAQIDSISGNDVTVTLSDNESCNDGSFILTIQTL